MNNPPSRFSGLLNLLAPPEPARSDESALCAWASDDAPPEYADDAAPPCVTHFDPQYVFWAMHNLPAVESRHHFCISGIIGSGKTVTIQLFLQSIAPRFGPRASTPEQLIVFDAKGDMVSLLAALGLPPTAENVWILNPFDARSAVWDLSEGVRSPAMARYIAKLIVPEEKNSTAPYFTDAARELIFATIMALNHVAPGRWTLRDLLCALDSLDSIAAVTAQHPRAHQLADRILSDDKHAPSVLSTLATKIGQFESVAALWHTNTAGRRFTIERFLAEPGVLILGNDPVLRDSFWPINALLLKSLTQEILRRPNTPGVRHWFVLDEFRAMQRVECVQAANRFMQKTLMPNQKPSSPATTRRFTPGQSVIHPNQKMVVPVQVHGSPATTCQFIRCQKTIRPMQASDSPSARTRLPPSQLPIRPRSTGDYPRASSRFTHNQMAITPLPHAD